MSIADGKQKRKLIGSTVMAFECRGCMAEDHVFLWAGVVEGFQDQVRDPKAVIDVLKEGRRDRRDGNLGRQVVAIHDPALQELSPGIFALFL